jgi:hypothetical protein
MIRTGAPVILQINKECYARETNPWKSTQGQEARQSALHPGRRVRARRDPSRSQRHGGNMDDAPVATQKNRRRKFLHWWIIALIVVVLIFWWVAGATKAR